MSKAILVLDEMPQYCLACPFCYEKYHEGSWCDLLNESVPQWKILELCPLKEAPEYQFEWNNDIAGDWERGYNACLDEILGGD